MLGIVPPLDLTLGVAHVGWEGHSGYCGAPGILSLLVVLLSGVVCGGSKASCKLPLFGGGWCNERAVGKPSYVASNFDRASRTIAIASSHGLMQQWTPFSSDVTRPV